MKTLTIEEKRARLVIIRNIVASLQCEAKNLRNEINAVDDEFRHVAYRLVDGLRDQMEK